MGSMHQQIPIPPPSSRSLPIHLNTHKPSVQGDTTMVCTLMLKSKYGQYIDAGETQKTGMFTVDQNHNSWNQRIHFLHLQCVLKSQKYTNKLKTLQLEQKGINCTFTELICCTCLVKCYRFKPKFNLFFLRMKIDPSK